MKKLLKAPLWLLVLLLVLELALQLGALFIKEHSWRAKSQWLTGDLRVLTLGDSNTYGLYLPAEDAYPAQLQDLWNNKHPEYPIEVINLGYPGSNSFRLLANLPKIIDSFQPDLVLIMIGFNDFWTPEEHLAQPEDLPPLQKILSYSRVYKLLYMATRDQNPMAKLDLGKRKLGGISQLNLTEDEIHYIEDNIGMTMEEMETVEPTRKEYKQLTKQFDDAIKQIAEERQQNPQPEKDILNTVKYGDETFSLGIADGSSARHSKQMVSNIKNMLSLLEQNNIPHMLLNYPTQFGYYPPANKKIAQVADETGVAFIDLRDVFHPDCRKEPKNCPELLYYDAHATAKGNQLVAERVLLGLEAFYFSR